MSTHKRERDLARAKYERQQARRAERKVKARRNQMITATVVVVALVVAVVGWWGFQATNQAEIDASVTPTISPEPSEAADSPAPSPEATGDPLDEVSVLECTPIGTPRPNDISYPDGPGELANGIEPTTMTLSTNCGDIVIELNPAAPQTVASEAFLADSGFYNNTQCHRLTTEGIFVLQCGDPAGDGTGGPGYAVPDENLPTETGVNYPAGTVAMANAGPGTSGSQFFIVYEDTTLPPAYTIWGSVISGLDIVQEVGSIGVSGGGADGPPAQPVFINQATVS